MEISGSVSSIIRQKGPNVWSISPDATVFSAVEMMSAKNVGALPVVNGDELLGIVSERDYTRKVVLAGKSSKNALVREIMTTPCVFAGLDDSISDCMRLMTESKVRHLPILDGEKIVGIISIGDLIKWVMSSQAATIEQLERYLTGG